MAGNTDYNSVISLAFHHANCIVHPLGKPMIPCLGNGVWFGKSNNSLGFTPVSGIFRTGECDQLSRPSNTAVDIAASGTTCANTTKKTVGVGIDPKCALSQNLMFNRT